MTRVNTRTETGRSVSSGLWRVPTLARTEAPNSLTLRVAPRGRAIGVVRAITAWWSGATLPSFWLNRFAVMRRGTPNGTRTNTRPIIVGLQSKAPLPRPSAEGAGSSTIGEREGG